MNTEEIWLILSKFIKENNLDIVSINYDYSDNVANIVAINSSGNFVDVNNVYFETIREIFSSNDFFSYQPYCFVFDKVIDANNTYSTDAYDINISSLNGDDGFFNEVGNFSLDSDKDIFSEKKVRKNRKKKM